MPLAEALFREFGDIKTIVNNINSRRAAIASGERETILIGEGYITDAIGPFEFQISANSFFQTNSSGALKLYEKVKEYAELKGSEIVLDLYCGTGTIPILLSGSSKEVIGMEIAESAILDANRNSRANGADNCRFIPGDIRETLSGIRKKPDVMIIDPPRAGIHKDILAEIMRLKPGRVVYVSCNPTTMARDIARMMEHYDLIEIQPVDMFPHTYHIEAVAKMLLRQ
jgi:23S rRNA (uracil1939-C5)-methyltransferase